MLVYFIFWTVGAAQTRPNKGPSSAAQPQALKVRTVGLAAAAGALTISHATMPNWSHALMTGSFLRNMASMMRMESLMSVSRHTEKSTAFLLMV